MDTLTRPILDIAFKSDTTTLASSRNIAAQMTDDDAAKIGAWAKQGFEDDKQSRSQWETFYGEAIKLALQVKEAKSFPWTGCSNVKFPLLTIAALNAHAQAFPALINGKDIVKCQPIGQPTTEKIERAQRVANHMSFQLLETMPWEEQTDKQILVHYILGTTFKKTCRDNGRRKNYSDLVMPQDLVVNYWSRDMESAPRASHIFNLTKNEIVSNINAQIYRDCPEGDRQEQPAQGPLDVAKDKAQLTTAPPGPQPVNFLVEQSCWLDLDQDGYDEPYAVTFDRQTGYLYRIVARYLTRDVKRNDKGRVLSIEADNYYTKYELIPSPDGGFYGLGLGRLLGPINDAIDTSINQIFDSTTMRLLGGGFLGRGVRIKGGDSTFKPFEYKSVESTGDDIRKSILPLQTGDVPTVLLDLLKYLVDYGERIGSAGDIQMGKIPGQNVKAETAAIANENGKLIFNATYKRFWRSMKEEFRKLYRLNQLHQQDEEFNLGEKYFKITKGDYIYPEAGIIPAADPNIVSKSDRRQAADMVLQTAMGMGGGGHDMDAVIRRRYVAYDIPDIEQIYPGLEKKPPQPNPKQIEAEVKMQREKTRMLDVQKKSQLAAGNLLMKAKESHAKIVKMMAEVNKLMAEAKDIDTNRQLQSLEMLIKAEEERRDDAIKLVDILMETMNGPDGEGGTGEGPPKGGMGGMEGAGAKQGVRPVPKAAQIPSS